MKHFTFAVCVLFLIASADPATAQPPKDLKADKIGAGKYVDRSTRPREPYPANLSVLLYAKVMRGTGPIGDGQCTALVEAALKAARAKYPGNYVWGTPVALGDVQPGDILQFEGVKFESPNSRSNYPHHTAIVQAVNGTVLTLIHQNVGTRDPNQKPRVLDSRVRNDDINLAHKTQGTIQAYRPTR